MQIQRDSNAIEASEKIKGSLDSSHVDCDNVEEAIGILFCVHKSVDKQKISVRMTLLLVSCTKMMTMLTVAMTTMTGMMVV